jgi:hypothetical protein
MQERVFEAEKTARQKKHICSGKKLQPQQKAQDGSKMTQHGLT